MYLVARNGVLVLAMSTVRVKARGGEALAWPVMCSLVSFPRQAWQVGNGGALPTGFGRGGDRTDYRIGSDAV
jgi:hypothetical protein